MVARGESEKGDHRDRPRCRRGGEEKRKKKMTEFCRGSKSTPSSRHPVRGVWKRPFFSLPQQEEARIQFKDNPEIKRNSHLMNERGIPAERRSPRKPLSAWCVFANLFPIRRNAGGAGMGAAALPLPGRAPESPENDSKRGTALAKDPGTNWHLVCWSRMTTAKTGRASDKSRSVRQRRQDVALRYAEETRKVQVTPTGKKANPICKRDFPPSGRGSGRSDLQKS